jgi:hypothetical protein
LCSLHGAFGWRKALDEAAGSVPQGIDGSCSAASQQRLQFGERLFDRVEVWA